MSGEPGTTAPSASAPTSPASGRGFFGHPWGLANLSGIEMWERFSFYGMQAIVTYYIYYSMTDGGLGHSEADATSIIGAYGGGVYLSTILGAWVSDRIAGAARTLIGAASLIMLGHILLAAIPGMAGVASGLVLVALGAGALKATTSTVVGDMYDLHDRRRDAAFSIYYMAVNIGAFFGPLLTGWIWKLHGFHWGFALAAIGMALGITQYLAMHHRTLRGLGEEVPNPISAGMLPRYVLPGVAVAGALVIALGSGALPLRHLATVVSVLIGLAAVSLFGVILASPRITAVERSRVVSFIPMFLASVAFWSLFQQQFTVLAVYADKRLDRNILGMEVPPTIVQSINPFFIVLFAGVFAAMWTRLGDRGPSTPVKFAVGAGVMGLAFLGFLPFVGASRTPLLGIVAILFLFTMAELSLSPVGQSLATKLAPKAFHTQVVALFFLSVALGSSIAGWLATYYKADDPTAERTYFLVLGLGAIAVGAWMVALRSWILEMMSGIR